MLIFLCCLDHKNEKIRITALFHFAAYWYSVRKVIGLGQKMRFLMEASQTCSDRFFTRFRGSLCPEVTLYAVPCTLYPVRCTQKFVPPITLVNLYRFWSDKDQNKYLFWISWYGKWVKSVHNFGLCLRLSSWIFVALYDRYA